MNAKRAKKLRKIAASLTVVGEGKTRYITIKQTGTRVVDPECKRGKYHQLKRIHKK